MWGDPPHVTSPIWSPPLPCKQALRLAKQQSCTCSTHFCTFLCRHCTITTSIYLIPRFKDDANKRRRVLFSLFKPEFGPQEINSREIYAYI